MNRAIPKCTHDAFYRSLRWELSSQASSTDCPLHCLPLDSIHAANKHVSPRLTFNSGLTIDIKQITYQWNSSLPTIHKIVNARWQTFRVIINLTLPDQSQRSKLLVTANDALSAVCRIAKCGMQNLWWYQVCLLVVPHGSHNDLILWPPLTVLFTRWEIHRCHICLNQHQVVSHSCMRFGTTLCDFLPQDAMLVRYLLSPCICPIICLTICNS